MKSLASLAFATAVPILAAEQPGTPPEGFAWKRIESVKASFLIPRGWHFKEELKDGTRGIFITREDIDKAGSFETGLTVNVMRLKKDPAQARAALFVAGLTRENRVLDQWENEAGVLRLFGCRVRRIDEGHAPLIMHVNAIGNSRTNTLYLLIFESPEPDWEEAWKQGEPMMKTFYLDDEY